MYCFLRALHRFLRITVIYALLASCFIHAASLPSYAREQVKVAMILFRGETPAEKGFIETLQKSPQFDVKLTIFDVNQNAAQLDRLLETLNPAEYRLIYTFGTTVTQKVMKKVRDTPIVFNIVQRPVEGGIVKAWEHSGNNVTGASNYVSMESALKTLKLVMHIHKLGFMYYVNDPSSLYQKVDLEELQTRSGFIKFDLPIQNRETIPQTLKSMLDLKPDAVMFPSDSLIKANAHRIISTLNKHKIPSIVIIPEMVKENGALIALGPDYYTLGRLAAENALEILNGKKPTDIPVKRVAQLNITINLRTADRLGATFPIQLLRLSEVIR